MKFLGCNLFLVVVFTTIVSCSQEKMNGVNLVAPPQKITTRDLVKVKEIDANWVAVIPYGFTKGYGTKVYFDENHQWWGEKTEGVLETIKLAKQNGLKVMLKPHIWFGRNISATDFKLEKEQDWLDWEKSYTTYILTFAKIAKKEDVDLFCFSTELKQVVLRRPLFYKELIKKIKEIYKGKLTYAANWDNYEHVTFWKDLDYIGVDAYFPLSDKKEPTVLELNYTWVPLKNKMKALSKKVDRPILFTEYGFESCNYNTKETWGSHQKYAENQQAQVNAYQSFYETFYEEQWFAGGFLWKWHLTERTKRNVSTSFTPQEKKAIELIKKRFRKN